VRSRFFQFLSLFFASEYSESSVLRNVTMSIATTYESKMSSKISQ